jgi:hypothetical protein
MHASLFRVLTTLFLDSVMPRTLDVRTLFVFTRCIICILLSNHIRQTLPLPSHLDLTCMWPVIHHTPFENRTRSSLGLLATVDEIRKSLDTKHNMNNKKRQIHPAALKSTLPRTPPWPLPRLGIQWFPNQACQPPLLLALSRVLIHDP